MVVRAQLMVEHLWGEAGSGEYGQQASSMEEDLVVGHKRGK